MADCYHRTVTASGKCADCGANKHGTISHVVAAFRNGNVTVDRNGNTREPRARIRSGNGNLASVYELPRGANPNGFMGATFLQSHGVTIAVRRDSDGAIFLNAHSYSPSTGGYQRKAGASWRDGVSFPALVGLLGPTWYQHAEITESAPQSCTSEHCEAQHDQAFEAWSALRVQTGTRTRAARGYECSDDCPDDCPTRHAWHPDANAGRVVTEPEFAFLDANGAPVEAPEFACLFPNIQRETSYSRQRKLEEQGETDGQPLADVIPADIMVKGAHDLTVEGSERYGPTYTLLETVDPITGERASVICGFERGRANGRTDQLWAAICPRNVENVVDALASLNPFHNRSGVGPIMDADVKRQGDLFFAPFAGECPCPCHNAGAAERGSNGAAEALRRSGLLCKDGTIRKRHGCTRAGEAVPQLCKRRDSPPSEALRLDGLELPDAGGRHVATRAALTARNVRYAQGQIIHPEHPTLMLHTWHRVGRSLATRAMSAAYRQGWRGGVGYAD